MPAIYPFTAIVGQERMKRALILNAVDTRIGGVLIRGERGTAKSTAARALAALLPKVHVVDDCRFGCDPDRPATWCTECKERFQGTTKIPFHVRTTSFVNLPVSATDDHVVDVLLDSAAMGVNMVEREGISFSHPSRFILVGTMNPEEGELRPQLLDRFALSVDIVGIREARERVMIMERNLAFEQDAEVFRKKWMPKEEEISHQIERARELVGQVTHTSRDLLSIAALTSSLNVDGHRADLVILKAARAQAAFEGRTKINDHDIALAAELAQPHRIKRTPFQQAEMTTEQLQERIEQLQGQSMPSEAEEESESQQNKAEEKKT